MVGNTVRLDRIADVLAEEVDRAREPRRREAMRAAKGILRPRPGDVAPGQPVGAPLPTGEGAHRAIPSRARREREQDAPSGHSNGHPLNDAGDGLHLATPAIPVGPRAPAASDPSVELSAPAIENGQVKLAQAGGLGEDVDLGDPAPCDFSSASSRRASVERAGGQHVASRRTFAPNRTAEPRAM